MADTPYEALDRAQLAVGRWVSENAAELLSVLDEDPEAAELAAELREVLASWRQASDDVRAFVHGLRGGDDEDSAPRPSAAREQVAMYRCAEGHSQTHPSEIHRLPEVLKAGRKWLLKYSP